MRDTNYQFVDDDAGEILDRMILAYEQETGNTLRPADPDRVFLSWVANAIAQERFNLNYAGNQNIPSRAEGQNLDAVGQWIYGIVRLSAQSARCTVRFTITEAQATAIAIPAGTRVTDQSSKLTWATTADALIAIGDTYADAMVECQTPGEAGNGYIAGQINKLIDVDNIQFFASCANTDTSSGGSNEETDEEYFDRMRVGLDSYSSAGPSGAYEYWAKSVSPEISDVKAILPKIHVAKTVDLYADSNSVKHAFLGGNHIDTASLVVKTAESGTTAVLNTDYTVSYASGLLTIAVAGAGILASLSDVYVTYDELREGYVNIYALMDDGTIADPVTKAAILSACSNDAVRPLTDFVSVEDPGEVTYNIDLTYYIDRASSVPIADIQAAVTDAVNRYIAWQSEKLGRDINPSQLTWFLANTGIKRAVITTPIFTTINSGANHEAPQVAKIGTVTLTNGGYEE